MTLIKSHRRERTVLVAALLLGWPLLASAAPKGDIANPSASPSAPSVRAEVLAYLPKKSGAPLVLPVLSASQTPLQWLEAQQVRPSKNRAAPFQIVGESLLLSQAVLGDTDPKRRQGGLLLASETANFIVAHLENEKWLLARVYQGFILPYLSLANVESWRDPSRQRLLETAVAAFGEAGERDAQKRVLEWLLTTQQKKVAATPGAASNTLDWVRGTLASLLIAPKNAPRADLERAMQLLQSITSTDMTGFAHLRVQLQTRLQNQAPSPAPPPAQP